MPRYRLHALAGQEVPKPGLLRTDEDDGMAIDVEVWRLAPSNFGRFVAGVPAPLSIGTLELEDGTRCKGFLVEPTGLAGAEDISAYGGWRRYIERTTRRRANA